jgi:PAS domain S-box-containing protein
MTKPDYWNRKYPMCNAHATILNVNDDEIGRYATTRVLKNAGFTVWEAASGAEALVQAQSHPDLIVLDVQLPDMSGFEVCRKIKGDPRTASIAILHLSASFVNSQDKTYGLEGGADGYLTQPVEAPVLIAHIKALLRMRRAEAMAKEQAIQWQTTFDSLGDGILLLDDEGRVLQCNRAMAQLLGEPANNIQGRYAAELASTAPELIRLLKPGQTTHEINEVQVGTRWFLVTTDPIRADLDNPGSILAWTDITQRKYAEEENLRLLQDNYESALRQRAFVRDILSSVTDGKLHLCDSPDDLPARLPPISKTHTLTHESLSSLRLAVREALQSHGFSEERIGDMLTAVSEAAMNAVVHAGGGQAKVSVAPSGSKAQVWIQDRGGGIAVDRLPQATLQRGYTTAGTLGHGFKMMLQCADRIWLLTGTNGTTVVVEQERSIPMPLLD